MAATFFSAAIGHETNTFAVTPTRMADFDFAGAPAADASPERIRRRFRSTRTVHGGYLAAAEERGFELEPLLWAFATPAGVVERTAYEELAGVLLERLARRRRDAGCRGVLLDLHGAMVSEHLEDVEGDLIERTREVLGASVPLVVTVDLHANVTERMAAHADAIVGFEEYPHVDAFERGVQAGRLIHAAAAGTVRPRLAYVQLPLVTMPPKQCTLIPPARALLRRAQAVAREPTVLDATIAYGFPFADIRDAGTSVLVTADGSAELAAAHAAELARAIWRRRRDFDVTLTPVAEAIRFAREEATGLVVLADGSDNPTTASSTRAASVRAATRAGPSNSRALPRACGGAAVKPPRRYLRGLFCGGTLAAEALEVVARRLGPVNALHARTGVSLPLADPA